MPLKSQTFSSFSLLNLANEDIESTAAKTQLSDLFLDNEFFSESWHNDNYQATIIDDNECRITWRLKERMKTSGVALAICLNNGTDPPDIVRPPKCARKECWFDPTGAGREKGVEKIGNLLQQQYEKVQSKARYKLSLDPTPEDLRRTCLNLRKQARNERLLLHYNGHGVPRPTANGELWAFGKHYTHYMPISIYELRNWFGDPAIYVFDCSGAAALLPHFTDTHPSLSAKDDGNIYAMFDRTMAGRSPGMEEAGETPPTRRTSSSISDTNSLVLCACKAEEILPMNPLFPADVFTSCLTTPLRIAVRWFILQNPHLSGLSVDMAENIPGKDGDRKTPRGELNWLFTAVTDTIAWNVLSPTMFQKLFRQDLLVASLFRNFLLAKRIMKSLNCNPVSLPPIPDCTSHPMWRSWDMAVESCLLQLHALQKPGGLYEAPLLNASSGASSFFTEHLNSFEVWLSFGGHDVGSNEAPIHLPILLQVLLSQSHRMKALQLLRKYLCQGPEAANSALLVGIFPYILKLLQNNDSQIRHVLIAIWTYIIGFDCSCRNELLRERCLPVFSQCMVSKDAPMKLRAMAAFVMAEICNGYRDGQQACLQSGLHRMCQSILMHENLYTNSELRKWVVLCISRLCEDYNTAKHQCIMDDIQSCLYVTLLDSHPMVRAASVLALGELFGAMTANGPLVAEFTREQTITRAMELNIAIKVLETCQDGCVMVRREAVLALAKVFVSPGHNDCIKLIANHVFQVLDWDPIRDVTDRNTFASETSRSSRVASTPKRIPTKDSPSPTLDLPMYLVDSATNHQLVYRLRELIVIQEAQSIIPSMGESLLGPETDGRGSTSPCLPPEQPNNPDEEQIIGLCSGYIRLWLGLLEVYCSEPHPSVVKAVKSILRHIYSQIAVERNSDLSLNAPDGSSIIGGWGSLPCRGNGSPTKPSTNASPRASLSSAAPPPPAAKPNRKTLSPARFFSKHKHLAASPQKNAFEMGTRDNLEVPPLRTSGLRISVPSSNEVDDINLFSPKDIPSSPWMRGVDITADGAALASTPQMFVDISLLSTTYDWNRKLFLRPEKGYRAVDDPITLEGQEKINRAAYRDDILDLAYRISNAFRPIEDLGRVHMTERDTLAMDDSLPESRTVISSGTSNSIDVSMLPVGATKFVCKALIPIPNSDVPSSVMFHSMHDVMAVCDGAGVDIWSLESGKNMLQIRSPSNRGSYPDNDPQQARVTSMGWINETVNSLLMMGCEDGTVRIWRDVGDALEDRTRYSGDYMAAADSSCSPSVTMVSAFTALPDIHKTSRGSGLVSSWQQSNGMLTVGGNTSTIRLWDVTREQCVRVYETKSQTCTTCIVSQSSQKSVPANGRRSSGGDSEDASPSFSWCFAGFADGSIGIYDQRIPSNGGRVGSAREHSSWIVNAFLRCDVPEVITGAVKGDVRFWDIRTMKTYKTIEVHKSPLTALSVHNVAPILATGSHAQFIKIVTFGGDQLGMIRHHDGFFGQRIGQVSCLAFHPVRMMLAMGATDNIVSIYGVQDG